MRPRTFRYHRPESCAEALEILAGEDEDARILGGGQSLVPLMNLRFASPSSLVDVTRCQDLRSISVDGEKLVLGTAVTQREGELSPAVLAACPLVAAALRHNGHPATRHRGTVGGTLAHADPAGELPGVAMALGAELVVAGSSGRQIVPAEEFFLGALVTCIEPGEMLVEARFPVSRPGDRWGFAESGIRSHDLAIAGVALSISSGQNGPIEARAAGFGISPTPLRLFTLEDALADTQAASAIEAAVMADLEDVDILENLHASADYRRSLTASLAVRAVNEALGRKGA